MGQDVQLERLAALATPLNQPTKVEEISGPTFVGGCAYLVEKADKAALAAKEADNGAAIAEFVLAKRHIEDAVMRFNRGMALALNGYLTIADLEEAAQAAAHEEDKAGEGVIQDA